MNPKTELRIAIAKRLGWHWTRGTTCASDPTVYRWFHAPGVHENFPKADGTEPICRDPLLDVPDWTGDIRLAWELDGEGWGWQFIESEPCLGVTIWRNGKMLLPDVLREPWRESKAATYAVARCRAWLEVQIERDLKCVTNADAG